MMTPIEKIYRIATLREELERLEKELQASQENCEHHWSKPVYDPIVTPHMEISRYEGKGSDPEPVMRKTGSITKKRWRRYCPECGKKTYTEKQKHAGIQIPDFGE